LLSIISEDYDKMFVIMNNTKDKFLWVDWIIKEREKRGMTQADLARATGLQRSTVSDYEKRLRTKPDVEALAKISEALGYPAEYLPRLANQFPYAIEVDDDTQQLIYETNDLTPQEKEEILAFIRMKKNLRQRNAHR